MRDPLGYASPDKAAYTSTPLRIPLSLSSLRARAWRIRILKKHVKCSKYHERIKQTMTLNAPKSTSIDSPNSNKERRSSLLPVRSTKPYSRSRHWYAQKWWRIPFQKPWLCKRHRRNHYERRLKDWGKSRNLTLSSRRGENSKKRSPPRSSWRRN